MNRRGRDHFRAAKPFLMGLSRFFRVFPASFRVKLLTVFSSTKGEKGIAFRYALLKSVAKTCGDNVAIHRDVYLFSPERLSIGNNVSIHPMCYIDSSGEIEIGNDVSIAHAVTILSTEHRFDSLQLPVKDQGVKMMKTSIGDDVWIGAKASLLAGVVVGSGSIIGTGGVVTKNIPARVVAVGVPAHIVRKRGGSCDATRT